MDEKDFIRLLDAKDTLCSFCQEEGKCKNCQVSLLAESANAAYEQGMLFDTYENNQETDSM